MKVKIDEIYAVFLSFIYCFCILAAYYIMRPLRDQLAVEAGSGQLIWFFTAAFCASLLLTPLFSWLVSRWPRKIVLPVTYLFFIGCQIGFVYLFNHHELLSTRNLGALFFVWVSVFNLFAMSVFWSFMTDIWSELQARSLFPIIALGGTSGAIMGPFITRTLVEFVGLSWLLGVSIGFLSIAIICVILLDNWARKYSLNRHKPFSADSLGGSMFEGIKQIFSNAFIATMSFMMLLGDAIGTIAYVLVTDYSGKAFPHNAIAQTQFAADMDLSANIIQIILQLTATRWLLVRYGPGPVFVICAFIVTSISLATALMEDPSSPIIGSFPAIAIVLIISRSLAHSMILAAREILYTLVPRKLRYKGKNAVDTVVWRAGDILSLLSINGLRVLGVGVTGFAMIWAVLAAVSGWVGWRLSKRMSSSEN